MTTTTQLKAGFQILVAVSETIREAGPAGCPSGPLYARLMGQMDLAAYQRMVAVLVGSGLVVERGHVLHWVGPAKETN